MWLDRSRRLLRGAARGLLSRLLDRYGYALAPSVAATPSSDAQFEQVPKGMVEPFTIGEYEVLPRDRFDVVRRDYYSPIPDLSLLPEDIWRRRSELGGVRMDLDAAIGFVEADLKPHVEELEVPLEDPHTPGSFFLHNTGFESVDAELLYAMVRAARPKTVIELGSGYSSLLINLASKRNVIDGFPTRHIAYDPFPREHVLGASLPEPSSLESISATDVPLEVFEALGVDDVLFVDTTHTVKLGSDVNFIVLEVLPRLRPGVLVHFHDVFLPWEYPRQWFEQMQFYWAEQYLLQAFLAFNSEFSVIVPACALSREHPDRLARAIPSFARGANPGSIWLRRIGSGPAYPSKSN